MKAGRLCVFSTLVLIFSFSFLNAQTPTYSISEVTQNNPQGVADSVGVKCFLHGLAVGVDLQGGPGQIFTMVDTATGIVVLSSTDLIPGYILTEGDSLQLRGTISQARGLTYIDIDSMRIISSGNTLRPPKLVKTLSEATEGNLVRINDLQLVDPAEWPQLNGQFGRVFAYNGTDTIEIIIDPDTDIEGTAPPFGLFDVIGTGSQRDDVFPFTENYLIFPQRKAHIIRKGYFPGVPSYNLQLLITEDSLGVADSSGVYCQTVGRLNSSDLKGGKGLRLAFMENNNYLIVESDSDFQALPTLKLGDFYAARGQIVQRNGMTFMHADSIVYVTLDSVYRNPEQKRSISEPTEGRYVRFEHVRLKDTLGWPAAGQNATVGIIQESGSEHFYTIDSSSNIDGSPIPYGFFNLIGYVFQNDTSIPYLSNYGIQSNERADIIPLTSNVSFVRSNEKVIEGNFSFDVAIVMDFPQHIDHEIIIEINEGPGIDTADYATSPASVSDTIRLIYPALADTAFFTIQIKDDQINELRESIDFNIVGASVGVNVGASSSFNVSIQDNDSRNISFSVDKLTVPESAGTVPLQLISSQKAPGTDTILVLLSNGPGLVPADYSTTPVAINDTMTLYINAGDTSSTFSVTVVDDALSEALETLNLEIISFSSGLVLGNNSTLDFSIQDNEPRAASFQINALALPEDTGQVLIPISLSSEAYANGFIKVKITRGLGISATDFRISPILILDTLTLPVAVGNKSLTITLDILDDLDREGSELFDLEIVQVGSGLVIGAAPKISIRIIDNDVVFVPTYNISTVNTVDNQGVADSTGVICNIQGIVLGIDFDGLINPSNRFTILDNTGGIGVRAVGGFNPPYVVTEGDEVLISGTISQTNGLTYVLADSLNLVSQGNALPVPISINRLDEGQESRLARFVKVELSNPANWPSIGIDADLAVNNVLGNNNIRIDADTDIDGSPAPRGQFTIIGIGTQDDASSPFDSNYFLMPRSRKDIVASDHMLLNPGNASSISLRGLGTQVINFTSTMSTPQFGGNASYTFLMDSLNGDFSTPIVSLPTNNLGSDTVMSLNYQYLDDLLSQQGVGIGSGIQLKWTIKAANSLYNGDAAEFVILVSRNGVALEEIEGPALSLYPNPGRDYFQIKSVDSVNERFELQILSQTGQVVHRSVLNGDRVISTQDLPAGIYTIVLKSEKELLHRSWIKVN